MSAEKYGKVGSCLGDARGEEGIEMTGTWTRADADRMVRAARRLLAQAEAETAGAARIAQCEARLAEAIAIRDRY